MSNNWRFFGNFGSGTFDAAGPKKEGPIHHQNCCYCFLQRPPKNTKQGTFLSSWRIMPWKTSWFSNVLNTAVLHSVFYVGISENKRVPLNHLFIDGFSLVNPPASGVPPFTNPSKIHSKPIKNHEHFIKTPFKNQAFSGTAMTSWKPVWKRCS